MKLFDWFFKREAAASSQPRTTATESGGRFADRAQTVYTPHQAMNIAATFHAVELIAGGVAKCQMNYKRMNRAEKRFVNYDTGNGRQLFNLLRVRPNSRMTAVEFWRNLVTDILLRGNAFVLPVRDATMNFRELVLLSPGSVMYDVYADVYTVCDLVNGINGTYSSDDILHIKNVCMDGGYYGISTISYAALTLGVAATAENEMLSRFATGGKFKAMYSNNNTVTGFGEYQDEQLEKGADDVQAQLDAGKDIISVKGDVKLSPLSMTSADMQFLASTEFNVVQIARFFHVPLTKMLVPKGENYKSSEMGNVDLYADALAPMIMKIENELLCKLVPQEFYSEYKFEFDLSNLYRTDLNTQGAWNKSRLETGMASPNDLRRERGIAPVDGGDAVFVSCNVEGIELRAKGGAAGNG